MMKALQFIKYLSILFLCTFCAGEFQNPIWTAQQGSFGIQVMKTQARNLNQQVAALNYFNLGNTYNSKPVLDIYLTFTFDVDPGSVSFTGGQYVPLNQSRGSMTVTNNPAAGQQFQVAGTAYVPNSFNPSQPLAVPKQIHFQLQCDVPGQEYHLIVHGSGVDVQGNSLNGTSNEPCVSSLSSSTGPGYCLEQDGYWNSDPSVGIDYSTIVANSPIVCP